MISVQNVVLTPESRKKLKKIKYWSFGTVADTIECSTSWTVPVDTYEYSDLRDALTKGFVEFFSLEDPSMVEIRRFDSDILRFEKGVYPDYSDIYEKKRKRSPKKTKTKTKTKTKIGPKLKSTGKAKGAVRRRKSDANG